MEYPDLATDTSYLHLVGDEPKDPAPWKISTNPFERRMAMNLCEGTVISPITPSGLGRVLGTATRIRRQALTVDISLIAGEPPLISATVVGIYSHFQPPYSVDTASHFDLALREVSKSRGCFFVSVTPENEFWVHSEQALAHGDEDWIETLRGEHSLVSF